MTTRRRPPPFLPSDYVPETTELHGDLAWELWEKAIKSQDEPFPDTQPNSMTMQLANLRKGATAPGRARRAPGVEPGLDEVLLEARRGNRVCPQPERWQELFAMFEQHVACQPWPLPPEPLTGAAWAGTQALAKRMCLREQLEWAAAHGCLGKAFDLLQNLQEADWHYMGA